MKPSKAFGRAVLLGGVLASVTSAVGGQSYGPEPQRLMIGVAEFRPQPDFEPFIGQDGYMSLSVALDSPSSPRPIYFLAPLSLPEGAAIDELCLYANETQLEYDIHASLVALKLRAAGEDYEAKYLGGVSSVAQVGYRRYCAEMAEVVRGKIDVDGDGILDNVAYYVEVSIPYSNPDPEIFSFGGLRVTWRRPVSPTPSAPTFADVSDSHPFYQFIEALSASGITGGCGDGSKYCPDAALTRGQMAVFLAKALGLHWVE